MFYDTDIHAEVFLSVAVYVNIRCYRYLLTLQIRFARMSSSDFFCRYPISYRVVADVVQG